MFGSMFLLIVAICTTLGYFYWKSEYSTMAKTIDLIPGPTKIPFLGTFMDAKALMKCTDETNINKYGRIYRLWVLWEPLLCISSPQMAEVILTSKVNVNKGFYEMFEPWLGNGILLSGGEKWRLTRRLMTPAFHFKILDTFFDVFNKNAAILTQVLAKEIERSNTQEIDMIPFMKRCTLDIICETAMGISINAQLETDSRYIQAVADVIDAIMKRTFNAWRLFPDWMYTQLSPKGRQFRKDVSILHNFTKTVIQNKKRDIYEEDDELNDAIDNCYIGTKKKRAFLDLLLIASKEGADLSGIDIQDEVNTFMAAVGILLGWKLSHVVFRTGHDTTSIAVSMFLYCMATHPRYQKLVQDELDQVYGDSDRACTMNDMSSLKYMECCFKESLRLYATAPNVVRQTSENIELDGYKVPAGTKVCLQIFSLQRNPEYFPDPLTYDPDRFLPDRCVGRHPFAFVPFSAGPRNCLGQKFASFEAMVIISSLLRKFNFTYNWDRKPLEVEADLVLKFSSGVPLVVSPRY